MLKQLAQLALFSALATSVQAVTLVVDYTYDSGNFFSGNLTAKAALEAAAQDISNVITSTLGPVTTDVYTSTNGTTTATFDWSINFNNPTTEAPVTLATFTAAANEIRLFAGVRQLSGGIEVRSSLTPESAHASTLGVGGPAGASFNIIIPGDSLESEWNAALTGAASLSNAAMLRGGGPVIGTLTGSAPVDGAAGNFSLQFGALFGTLSMDIDTVWHYNHTTAVGVGENDFYSVALHEMLHAIGIGTSETWNSKTSGTSWTGTNVINLVGSGMGLISPGGDHIADGIMSTRISDGLAQETVMDPTITEGTRKTLTALDLAFLQDIGFSTVSAVPEPSRAFFLLVGMSSLVVLRRRNF